MTEAGSQNLADALRLAEIKGYDLPALAELLPMVCHALRAAYAESDFRLLSSGF
jgi:hypothetical protein